MTVVTFQRPGSQSEKKEGNDAYEEEVKLAKRHIDLLYRGDGVELIRIAADEYDK